MVIWRWRLDRWTREKRIPFASETGNRQLELLWCIIVCLVWRLSARLVGWREAAIDALYGTMFCSDEKIFKQQATTFGVWVCSP